MTVRRALTTLLAGLAVAVPAAPAAARDARTITCTIPSGTDLIRVTLIAETGGCPPRGEAIPRDWIVGTPEVVGSVPAPEAPATPPQRIEVDLTTQAAAGTTAVAPSAVAAAPVRAGGAGVPATVVAAVEAGRAQLARPATAVASAGLPADGGAGGGASLFTWFVAAMVAASILRFTTRLVRIRAATA